MTTSDRPPRASRQNLVYFPTKVTTYDRMSAFLVASVLCVGFLFSVLFVIWITHAIVFRPHQPKVFGVGGIEKGTQGLEDSMDQPSPEELTDIVEPEFINTLSSVHLAVALTHAPTHGTGTGLGRPGIGGEDMRQYVPPPTPIVPDNVLQRWLVHFSLVGEEAYAKQLDFFEIELGAIERKLPIVKYARNLSLPHPVIREGQRTAESRNYFVHASGGQLTQMSQALLNRAGIKTENCYLAQFFSTGLCEQLLAVEEVGLKSRSLDDVRKTVFAIRHKGDGYEIYVERYEFYPSG